MVKNLMFDLGGVIMDIDREYCVKAFKSLGMDDIDNFLGLYGQKGPFLELEEGKISPAEFRESIRRMLPAPVSDEVMDKAFNEFLRGIPVARLHALEELHRSYPTYLLSNTNAIMMNSRIDECFRAAGHDISYYFNGIVTSYEARSCKPAREIFDYAAKKFNINPAETLFFDDSQANVDAAIRYGYQAVIIRPGEEFRAVLDKYLNTHEQ